MIRMPSCFLSYWSGIWMIGNCIGHSTQTNHLNTEPFEIQTSKSLVFSLYWCFFSAEKLRRGWRSNVDRRLPRLLLQVGPQGLQVHDQQLGRVQHRQMRVAPPQNGISVCRRTQTGRKGAKRSTKFPEVPEECASVWDERQELVAWQGDGARLFFGSQNGGWKGQRNSKYHRYGNEKIRLVTRFLFSVHWGSKIRTSLDFSSLV